MIYAYSEKFVLVFSHDEVVHGKATMLGKMPGERKEQFANLRLTYAYLMTHPGKKLLFMGQDIGEYDEWNEERAVEWELLENDDHKKLNSLVADLNKMYTTLPAMYQKDDSWEGFEWINCITPQACMLSYLRKAEKVEDTLVVVANFANAKQEFTVGVPYEGKYKEILNTDSRTYGGSGCVNEKEKRTLEQEWDGKPYAIEMVSAPLSVSIFSYTPYTPEEKAEIERAKAEAIRKAKEEKERQEAEEAARITAIEAAAAKEAAQKASKEAREKAKAANDAAERLKKILAKQKESDKEPEKETAVKKEKKNRPAGSKEKQTGGK